MKKLTAGIFATLLTVVGVNAADAAVASKAYVDQEVGKKQDVLTQADFSATGAATVTVGTDGVITVGATDTDTKYTAGTNVAIDAANNNAISVDLSNYATTDSVTTAIDTFNTNRIGDLGNNAEGTAYTTVAAAIADAVADTSGLAGRVAANETNITNLTEDVAGKVDTAQGADAANHIVVTDETGNVTTAASIANTQVTGLGTLATLSAVGSDEITDGAVAAADLAANAVTTEKITDKNVTKAKLADDVQTSLGLADTALQAAGVNFLAKATSLPQECSDPTNYCVLTFNGIDGYYWEAVARAEGETGGKPAVTEP